MHRVAVPTQAMLELAEVQCNEIDYINRVIECWSARNMIQYENKFLKNCKGHLTGLLANLPNPEVKTKYMGVL